jgi:hypothetical protein
MKIIISPSKTMNYLGLTPIENIDSKAGNELTGELLKTLKSLDVDDLKKMYKASDKVVGEAMKANCQEGMFKSIELFKGLVFKNIDYCSMNDEEKMYIDDSLLIFSALYGLVSAGQAITPYRLDLNNSLKPHIVNLTRQWKPYVNQYIESLDTDIVIDLASTEYRKLVDVDGMKKNYIRIDFKDLKGGIYKSMSTFSKMARGQFVRQMALGNVRTLEGVKKLKIMNYSYDEEMSSERNLVFTR